MKTVSLILLAGGLGIRMSSDVPKTFLPLKGKPLVLHSFELFSKMSEIHQIVVVCPEDFRHLFPKATTFATPGKTRQDSVQSGFQETKGEILLIHDGARPFVSKKDILKLLREGASTGAATLGSPVKNTIKQVKSLLVEKTLERSSLYDIYTPQLLSREVYEKGYHKNQHTPLTDDVALAESIGHPVKIVEGCNNNLKITYPIDLKLAALL